MSSEDSATASAVDNPPPQKKSKRLQKYRREWEKDNPWLECTSGDVYKASCKACHRSFSVSHGGMSDVKQHASGAQHCKNFKTQKTQRAVSQFFISEISPETDSVCIYSDYYDVILLMPVNNIHLGLGKCRLFQ